YAVGYHGNRVYVGFLFVDFSEKLAIESEKLLFGFDYANVQQHSGSQAKAAEYNDVLKPGDTDLGMHLGAGGHLTHGS
ncbi:serine hydroxymethyltransferase, partial [Francisella tularensis subsp. holarctica]|nr:serine hydroxymethyltransferase [Francisella tularensis subsp. holarctica]